MFYFLLNYVFFSLDFVLDIDFIHYSLIFAIS